MRLFKHIFIFFLLQVAHSAIAQNMLQDKSIRVGVLSNGLTYYIKHNSFVPNTADFYIAQRVGSILEEPHQRGLAHFLEHMAFNGSKNFPPSNNKKNIIQWCESVGIKFGVNLNAYTSIDQTVYNISSVPVNKEGVVDTCLLILNDWSNFLTLDPKEIDKERGVVHEEWRTRRSGMAMQRLMEASASVIYKGTKYEDCMPIGDMSIIDNFPYKVLTDFYKKWYRPDLQAIIVVGDVCVDSVEAKIKTLFGAIPKLENAPERIYYPVNNNGKMIVFTGKDTEQPVASFSLYMKRNASEKKERLSLAAFQEDYNTQLVLQMLNTRLDKLVQEHSETLLSASVQDGSFFISATKDAFSVNGTFAKNKYKEGISLIVKEVDRARKQGFLASEWKLAKEEIINDAQNKFNDRDKIRNSQYVETCLNHFLESRPMLTPDEFLKQTKLLTKEVSLKEINAFAKTLISNKNMVATLFLPDQANMSVLSNEEIEKIILFEQAQKHTAYKEQDVPKHFIPKQPKSGKIIKEEETLYGYRLFTLSNGMRIFAKNTSFENDEINMRIFSLGGKNQYDATETPTLNYLIASVMEGGIGSFDNLTLQKMLLGKTINVSPFIGGDTQGIKGFSTVRNMPELFQLTHLYFTSPRTDYKAFTKLINSQKEFLALREVNPNVVYNDTLLSIVYNNDVRVKSIKAQDLYKVNYHRALEIYKECFSNAANFDVILTGNIDLGKLKPLLCRYFASLPSKNKREVVINKDVLLKETNETHLLVKPQSVSNVHTSVIFSAHMPYSLENEIKSDVLSQLLRIAYLESIREEKGAAYGINVSSTLSQFPFGQLVFKVSFKTAPEKYKDAIPLVSEELTKMANIGINVTELNKVKTYLLKTYNQVIITNDYWEEVLFNYLYNGIDLDKDYKNVVNQLTPQSLQAFVRAFVENMKRIEVTMSSEKIDK